MRKVGLTIERSKHESVANSRTLGRSTERIFFDTASVRSLSFLFRRGVNG
jgi:hypothetical protein